MSNKEFRLGQSVMYTVPDSNTNSIRGKVVGQGFHVATTCPVPGYIPLIPHVLIELDEGFFHLDPSNHRTLGYIRILVVHPDHLEKIS